jgi:hypothetical protein
MLELRPRASSPQRPDPPRARSVGSIHRVAPRQSGWRSTETPNGRRKRTGHPTAGGVDESLRPQRTDRRWPVGHRRSQELPQRVDAPSIAVSRPSLGTHAESLRARRMTGGARNKTYLTVLNINPYRKANPARIQTASGTELQSLSLALHHPSRTTNPNM